ncbi:hypothetical protein [Aneurinibacillus aneurinilyticus]|uniref:hypothetical protein n=1 Tax=Aneurinibacillus aneurinilyticus TaxID=1391 RepID=UPI0030B84DA1
MLFAVDTESELPIVADVTLSHVNDGDIEPTLMSKAAEASNTNIKFVMMDAGYESVKE